MPVFAQDFKSDIEIILSLAEGVCSYWNKNGGPDQFGILAFTSREAAELLSHEADRSMQFFPEEPGPFKRVAALLVLGRLTPLFALAAPNSKDAPKPVNAARERDWIPKFCFLLLSPAFSSLSVSNSNCQNHSLADWKGFPSFHSKAEFLLWLEWLCDYPNDSISDDERIVRRGRMILATSLILEAVYYQGPKKSVLCGVCDSQLGPHFGGLIFDAVLKQNKTQSERGQELDLGVLSPLMDADDNLG